MAALCSWRVSALTRIAGRALIEQLDSVGGMCGAIVTSPFDVVKTRLQSDLFREKHATVGLAVDGGGMVIRGRPNIFWHFVETGHILRYFI